MFCFVCGGGGYGWGSGDEYSNLYLNDFLWSMFCSWVWRCVKREDEDSISLFFPLSCLFLTFSL